MNTYIRKVKRDELQSLLNLYQHLHANDASLPDSSAIRQVWDAIMNDPKVHCLVADLYGEIAASCILVIIPNLTRGARPYGLIENVVTHVAHRRKGIATQLLHHALKMAWGENCYKVMLLTGSKREEVHQFYEQAGFTKGDKTGFIARPGV